MRKLKLDELGRASLEVYKAIPKLPVVVVLDNIRSAHNVGSIFRTADGFAIERIILTGITARPPHREIHKTAIGATESVDWEYAEEIDKVLASLTESGYRVILAEQTDESISLSSLELRDESKLAIVFGNEVAGISESVVNSSYEAVEIPQFGTKHSFNVAVSVGIFLWAVCDQLRV